VWGLTPSCIHNKWTTHKETSDHLVDDIRATKELRNSRTLSFSLHFSADPQMCGAQILQSWKYPPTALWASSLITTGTRNFLRMFLKDSNHVLFDLLPPKKTHGYNLRARPHQHILPIKNVLRTRFSGQNAVC